MAITWEPDFSQACSFAEGYNDHKNFCFTQSQDKTNDFIFLKSPKTLGFFLALFNHFWHHFSQEIPSLSHITKYGALTSYKVSEKANGPILRKRKDRQKVGQTIGCMDGLKDSTLLAMSGGSTRETTKEVSHKS